MGFLIAAYSLIWLLLGGYIWTIGKRQHQAMKEVRFLTEMSSDERV